jgi:hypothetical protein
VSEYSEEIATTPAASRRTPSMCSSRRRMRRPFPRPSKGIEVRLGQAMAMRSPRPAEFLTICL